MGPYAWAPTPWPEEGFARIVQMHAMAVKFQDYYETLGVKRSASADEIKQAFRNLARLHHPDVAKDKAAGEARFKEINEAYEVLGDPEKRRRYDELGAHWQEEAPPMPGAGRRRRTGRRPRAQPDFEFGGTGFSDFFESFFGGAADGYHRPSGDAGTFDEEPFPRPGSDIEADLLVTLEEALHGAVRKITLERHDGEGVAGRPDTYQVRIPPGVHEGQRIRLAGQGEPGHHAGATGDLYLRVRFARHPDFTVENSDLHCELNLAPWEAVLGTRIKIPTLDGPTSLRVPPGTPAGGRLRLRGLGLPRADGTRGDLYATVSLQIPTDPSPEERTLWEQLARSSSFKPRGSS